MSQLHLRVPRHLRLPCFSDPCLLSSLGHHRAAVQTIRPALATPPLSLTCSSHGDPPLTRPRQGRHPGHKLLVFISDWRCWGRPCPRCETAKAPQGRVEQPLCTALLVGEEEGWPAAASTTGGRCGAQGRSSLPPCSLAVRRLRVRFKIIITERTVSPHFLSLNI